MDCCDRGVVFKTVPDEMKVINELITYFSRSGAFCAGDLDALVKNGWLAPDFAHVNSDGTVLWGYYDYTDWEHENYAYDVEDPLDDGQLTNTKNSSAKRRIAFPTAARATVLEAWLKTRWPAWQDQLAPLRRITAGTIVGRLAVQEAVAQLRGAVDGKHFEWRDLWHALALNGFRDWFNEPGAHGPATKAFRAMLDGSNPPTLTKYRWILRYPTIAAACETVQAQRTLLVASNHLLEHEPDWIARRVRRSKDRLSLFVLTIADAARRFESVTPVEVAGESSSMPDVVPPMLPLPPGGQRLSALLAATLMNPRRMLPFLQHRPPTWLPGSLVKAETYSALGLRCPLAWNPKRLPEPNFTAGE